MLLDDDDFFTLFCHFRAEPRWVTSAGKKSIQLIGHCHHGDNHSALFDPSTLLVNCFSECGRGMQLHTWVKQACNLDSAYEAKEMIEEWIQNRDIDFNDRLPRNGADFEYKERPYEYKPNSVPIVPSMPLEELQYLYSECFETERLKDTLWHKEDGIDVEILKKFDITYDKKGNIILPHHNKYGDIVGLYLRSFWQLRKKVKEEHPEMTYKQLLEYPRAKYVPMLRSDDYIDSEGSKTSWSFPNSQNLYGLHKAKKYIKRGKKAIIFEGAKSVMLAHQFGYPFAVATHTFGAHLNHISMLIDCGAEEIILGFDKQYESTEGQAWELYERKTRELADKVRGYIKISRLIDRNDRIQFKDSPVDRGRDIFIEMYRGRENLTNNEIEARNNIHDEKEKSNISRSGINICRQLTEEEKEIQKQISTIQEVVFGGKLYYDNPNRRPASNS